MKKATLNTILSLISAIDTAEADAVRAELTAELNRGKEKADANRALYESARATVIGAIPTDTPATLAEIFEAVAKNLPAGFTKGKVQYALGHDWECDVNAFDGNPKTYTRKV